MSDLMKYKGFLGSVRYSDVDGIFYGKLEFIRGLVAFEGEDVNSLRKAFKEAVDDYLETCDGEGVEPQKVFSGSFNVRTGTKLHREVSMASLSEGVGLNQFVKEALEEKIEQIPRDREDRDSEYKKVPISSIAKPFHTRVHGASAGMSITSTKSKSSSSGSRMTAAKCKSISPAAKRKSSRKGKRSTSRHK